MIVQWHETIKSSHLASNRQKLYAGRQLSRLQLRSTTKRASSTRKRHCENVITKMSTVPFIIIFFTVVFFFFFKPSLQSFRLTVTPSLSHLRIFATA